MVIRDREGHAVGGLRLEDFQLFDKGKLQVITKFTIQTSASTSVAPASAASVSGDVAAASKTTSKPELPDRYVAYLFDDIHMQSGDLLQARQAANNHLDRALDAGMRAGVFTTSGRITQGFTDDVAKLHDAVNRIQPWTSPNDKTECLQISYYLADYLVNKELSLSPFGINKGSRLAVAMLAEADGCLHHPDDHSLPMRYLWQVANTALQYGLEETRGGLTVLRDLIAKMSALPGSRTIVLVSPGFIMSAEHRTNENAILDSAIRASVNVNSLDIRGVYTPLRTRSFGAEFPGANSPESAQVRLQADQDEAARSSDARNS